MTNGPRPEVPGVTVFPRGKGFAYYVDMTPDVVTGKRRRAYGGGFADENAAWVAVLREKEAIDTDRRIAPSGRTVTQFLAEWRAETAAALKHSTQVNYADYCSAYVEPHIGHRPLREISVKVLNGLYRQLLSSGRRKPDTNTGMYEFWNGRREGGTEPTPKEIAANCAVSYHAARSAILRYRRGRTPAAANPGLAPKTVQNVHRMLRRALADAVAWQYLGDNPALHATLPRQRRARRRSSATWTVEQLGVWLAVALRDEDAAMWALVATTGMRRSELAGVVRDLIDFGSATLTIEDTRIVVAGRAEDSDGKTDSSGRTISLDTFTLAHLASRVAVLDERREDFGEDYDGRGYLFCHPDGRPIHPDTITRRFNRLADRAGVPRIRLHDVRHTYATASLDHGIDLKIVSDRLGHANVIVTGQIYGHRSTGHDAPAADRMAKLIYGESSA